jgi:hypothetical protein
MKISTLAAAPATAIRRFDGAPACNFVGSIRRRRRHARHISSAHPWTGEARMHIATRYNSGQGHARRENFCLSAP